jgi:aldehyde:ferredoxin oxidoreductase
MGWNRKVLRVNLTAGTCTPEPLNMEWANDYLGSRGLGHEISGFGNRPQG